MAGSGGAERDGAVPDAQRAMRARIATTNAARDEHRPTVVVDDHLGSGVWQQVQGVFAQHAVLDVVQLRLLNGQQRTVRDLGIRFASAADSKLQKLSKHARSPVNWFRNPFARVYLVDQNNPSDFRKRDRARLREIIDRESDGGGGGGGTPSMSGQGEGDTQQLCRGAPWIVVHVSQSASAGSRKVFSLIRDEFNGKGNRKADRCCQLCLSDGPHSEGGRRAWQAINGMLSECLTVTFEARLAAYNAEVRKLSLLRQTSGWSFAHFFLVKASFAHMFENCKVHDEALMEYYELEVIYLENLAREAAASDADADANDIARARTGAGTGAGTDAGASSASPSPSLSHAAEKFGGCEAGDEDAALFDPYRKNLRRRCLEAKGLKEFDVRQYLFAKRALQMMKLRQHADLAELGQAFISAFTRRLHDHEHALPPHTCDAWVFTACHQLSSVVAEAADVAADVASSSSFSSSSNALPADQRGVKGVKGEKGERGGVEGGGEGLRKLRAILADMYIFSHAKLASLGHRFSVYEEGGGEHAQSMRTFKTFLMSPRAAGQGVAVSAPRGVSRAARKAESPPRGRSVMGGMGMGMGLGNVDLYREMSFEQELITMEAEAALGAAVEEGIAAEVAVDSSPPHTPRHALANSAHTGGGLQKEGEGDKEKEKEAEKEKEKKCPDTRNSCFSEGF